MVDNLYYNETLPEILKYIFKDKSLTTMVYYICNNVESHTWANIEKLPPFYSISLTTQEMWLCRMASEIIFHYNCEINEALQNKLKESIDAFFSFGKSLITPITITETTTKVNVTKTNEETKKSTHEEEYDDIKYMADYWEKG